MSGTRTNRAEKLLTANPKHAHVRAHRKGKSWLAQDTDILLESWWELSELPV